MLESHENAAMSVANVCLTVCLMSLTRLMCGKSIMSQKISALHSAKNGNIMEIFVHFLCI